MLYPLAFDSETALIRPAQMAPALACLTYATPNSPARLIATDNGGAACRASLAAWLADPALVLVGANVAYDFAVVGAAFPELLPAIFAAYDADRVTDVQIRQRLLDIAGGVYMGRFATGGVFIKHTYDLEALAKRLAGIVLQKDAWRLSYAEFIGTPLEAWPARALEVQAKARVTLADLEAAWAPDKVRPRDVPRAVKERLEGLREIIASDPNRCVEYPLDDARATLAVYQAQEKHAAYLADQYRQARAAFWLHLGSAWGLRTDAVGVETLRAATQEGYDALEDELRGLGLIRADGSRDTKLAKRRMIEVCRREGLTIRRTDGHADEGKCKRLDGVSVPDGSDECEEHVCLDADACNATEDDVLESYARISELKKVLTNDVEALSKGVAYPIHTRYGMAETGRTTSSKPNIQNLRRLPGIREAFVPRPGRVFMAADYPQLEAYTWAQCCRSWLGESRLAEALNAGLDPHLMLTATILGIDYADAVARYDGGDQEVADLRQLAKAGNFGFPGGMGAATMLRTTVKQLSAMGRKDVIARLGLDLARMERLKEEWLATWPEARLYFQLVKSWGPPFPEKYKASVRTLWTERVRGGATYCAACNNGFQALGVDCAKRAGWLIAKAQYTDPTSPLYNSRTVAFVHDEFIGEVDDTPQAHDAAYAMAALMAQGANEYLPDVPIPVKRIKPVLMRRWSKDAKPTFGVEGRLVPWE